jgi:predicted porin
MNKKLIALAVAGACVVPEAMAQTANPVTLYGRAYATFESVEAKGQVGATGPVVRRNRVVDQTSLLGVRGTEDLGGGLKAFFQLETQWKVDQNDTTFAARDSGVGLQGNWGSVLLGRWNTPWKVVTTAIDPFGDLTLGNTNSIASGAAFNNTAAANAYNRRDQNVVQYWSPDFMGLAVRVSYSANEGKTSAPCTGAPAGTTCNPRSQGASLSYTRGPLYLAYAYHELKDQTFTTIVATAAANAGTAPYAFGSAYSPKSSGNAFAGAFTFGPLKVGGEYQKLKRDVNTSATAAGTVTGFSDMKVWAGNLTWTMGNNQLLYQYAKAKDGGVNIITSATIARPAEPDCKMNAIGYQYNFSRRTFMLAEYVRIDNNATASCNFGSTDMRLGIVPSQDPQGVSVGLRHIF